MIPRYDFYDENGYARPEPCVDGDYVSWDDYEYVAAENMVVKKALQEISIGSGAFSRDPLEHAENCIDNMKEIAAEALRVIEGTQI